MEVGCYDYGWRMYDPQLARFHTVDPLTEYFPHQSPFVYANNNPIRYIDFLGLSGKDTVLVDPNVYEIEEVVCVGTRPSKSRSTVGGGNPVFGFGMGDGRWDDNLSRSRRSGHFLHLIDFFGMGVKSTNKVLETVRDFLDLISKFSSVEDIRKSEKLKIEGDTEDGAIERTIPDRYKENLDAGTQATEPAQAPEYVRTVREKLPSGHEALRKIYKGAPDTLIVLQRDAIGKYPRYPPE